MRKLVTWAALLGLVAAIGCEQITNVANDMAKQTQSAADDTQKHYSKEKDTSSTAKAEPAKTEEAPKPIPPKKTTGKEDFEGHYLQVWVDGKKTTNSNKRIMGDLIWDVPACSTTPTIQFSFDEKHLGALKATDVVINPVKDGKPDFADMWQCDAARAMKAGVPAKLDAFNHIAGGKLVKATALPPGEYSFKVQVNGMTTWDRQAIRVTVK